MSRLTRDLSRNLIFLMILFVGAIPQIFYGYSNYLWILLLPLCFIGQTFVFNGRTILIFLFSLCYTFPLIAHQEVPPFSVLLFYLLYPLIMYESGIYISRRFQNGDNVLWVLVMTVFFFASWSIFVNIMDFIETGEFVNMQRKIFTRGEDFLRATHHNSMLALAIGGIGTIFLHSQNPIEGKVRIFIILASIIALLATMHLLNRTGLVLAGTSLLIGFLWYGLTTKRAIQIMLIVFLLLIIYVVFIDGSPFAKAIEEGFLAREEYDEESGASFGGGRAGRWITGLLTIFEHPIGTDGIFYLNSKTQSHNFWLDVGVDSGWLAFILIISLTCIFYNDFCEFIHTKYVPKFVKGYITMLVVTLLLQFAVEPMMASVFELVFMWFFIWGMLDCKLGYRKKL